VVGDILQPTHLLFVLVVALLVLGPKRLPEVGRQLGNGLRDFRAAINGERSDNHEVAPLDEAHVEDEVAPTPPATPHEHEFAHEASETVAEHHEFGHETSQAADVDGVAREPATASAGEHEFAYETSEPAKKRVDPLS
jgi:sec-independent protein translocase protein TatA